MQVKLQVVHCRVLLILLLHFRDHLRAPGTANPGSRLRDQRRAMPDPVEAGRKGPTLGTPGIISDASCLGVLSGDWPRA